MSALGRFAHTRRQTIIPLLQGQLVEHFQNRSPEEIAKLLGREHAREREFLRRQAARIARDLPKVLGEADLETRREAMRKLLAREKRYMAQREKAMTARAHTTIESLDLEEASPEGAYWLLGGPVHQHTPGCLAMANRFWPWPVLRDVISPPVHPGCPCSLIGLDEAAAQGLVDPRHLPDVKDALIRAKRNADLEEAIQTTFPRWQIEDEMRVLEEAVHRGDVHAHSVRLRFAKGLVKGGQFMPEFGVSDRVKVKQKGRSLGRHVWMKGHHVHVPEGRSLARSIGGTTFTSPAGSTNVYRNGVLASTPDLPSMHRDTERPRGDAKRPRVSKRSKLAPTPVVTADAQRKQDATKGVERSLRKADATTPPVKAGDRAHDAHRALRSGGFKHDEAGAKQTRDNLVVPYSHRDGHQADVTYDRATSHVKSVKWSPAAQPSDTSALRAKLGLDKPTTTPAPKAEPTPAPTPEEPAVVAPTLGTGNPKWARQVARAQGGDPAAQWDLAQESIARGPNSEFSRALREQVGARQMNAWQRASEWAGQVPTGAAPPRYAVARTTGLEPGPSVGIAAHADAAGGPTDEARMLGTGHYFTTTAQDGSQGDGISLAGAHLHRPYDAVASRNLGMGLGILNAIARGTGRSTHGVDPATGERRRYTLADALDRMPQGVDRRDAQIFALHAIEAHRQGSDESAATHMMRAMGFDGVDNRHLPELDHPSYGSVLYSNPVAVESEPDSRIQEFADALKRATSITLADLQAGRVPGISAQEIRPGVSGHAGLSAGESLRISPTTGFSENGQIKTTLLAHEVGHHVAQAFSIEALRARQAGVAPDNTGVEWALPQMEAFSVPGRVGVYEIDSGHRQNFEETVSDVYSNLLHGGNEWESPPDDPYVAPRKALYDAVAAKAAEMGLPSGRIYRAVYDNSLPYSDPNYSHWEYVGPTAPTPLKVETYEGTPGNRDHITQVETGDIPTSYLADLGGVRGEIPGEHRNKQGKAWEKFLADIRQNGITDPIFITVDPGGKPQISEGNHRRDAAVALGMEHVPVLIRYYGHSERQGTVSERGAAGMPASPAQGGAMLNGKVGRWIWIRGRVNFVPQDATWEKESDGIRFTSPAGGTRVFRAEPGEEGIGTLVSEPRKRAMHNDVLDPRIGGTERGAVRPKQATITPANPGDPAVPDPPPEPDVAPEPPSMPEGIGLNLTQEERDGLLTWGFTAERAPNGVSFNPDQRESVNGTGLPEGRIVLGPAFDRLAPLERQHALDLAFGRALAQAVHQDDAGRDDLGKLWTGGKFEATVGGETQYLDRYSADAGLAQAYARMGGEDWRGFAAQYPDVALFAADQAFGRGYYVRPDVHAWLHEEDNPAPPTQELSGEAKDLAARLTGLTTQDARHELVQAGFVQHSDPYSQDAQAWRKVDPETQSVQTILLLATTNETGEFSWRGTWTVSGVEGSSYGFDPNQEPPPGDTPERLAYEMRGLMPQMMLKRMTEAGYSTMESRFNGGDMENLFVRADSNIAILVRTPNGYRDPVTDARPTVLTSAEHVARLTALAKRDPTVIPVGTDSEMLKKVLDNAGWNRRYSPGRIDLVKTSNEANADLATIDVHRVLLNEDGSVKAIGRPNATDGLAADDAEWQAIHGEMQTEMRTQISERRARVDGIKDEIRLKLNAKAKPDVFGFDIAEVELALSELGYRDQQSSRVLQSGQQSDTWQNRDTGARLTLRSKQQPRDAQGNVRRVATTVRVLNSGVPDLGRERTPPGSMPENILAMKADMLGFSDELAALMGSQSDIVKVTYVPPHGRPTSFNGFHRSDGRTGQIVLGAATQPSLEVVMRARADGVPLDDAVMERAVFAYHVQAHELIHGVHVPDRRGVDPVTGALGIEEWLTEDLSRQLAADWLERHGHHDILAWWKRNEPNVYESYHIHRTNGYQLLKDMGLGPGDVSDAELRTKMETWKYRMTEDGRREDMILHLIGNAGMTRHQADNHITALMGMATKDAGIGPVEGFRPRMQVEFPPEPEPVPDPLGVGGWARIRAQDDQNGVVGFIIGESNGFDAGGHSTVRYQVRNPHTGVVHRYDAAQLEAAFAPPVLDQGPTETLRDHSTISIGAMVTGTGVNDVWQIVGLSAPSGQGMQSNFSIRRVSVLVALGSDGKLHELLPEGIRGVGITDTGAQLREGDMAHDPITGVTGSVGPLDWSDPNVPRTYLTDATGNATFVQVRHLEPRTESPWEQAAWRLPLTDRRGQPRFATKGDHVYLTDGTPVELLGASVPDWPRGTTMYKVRAGSEPERDVPAESISGFQDELPVPKRRRTEDVRDSVSALHEEHYGGADGFNRDTARALVHAEGLSNALAQDVGSRFGVWAKANAVPLPMVYGREQSGQEAIQNIYTEAFRSRDDFARLEQERPALLAATMQMAQEAGLPTPDWSRERGPGQQEIPPGAITDRAVAEAVFSGTFGRAGLTAHVKEVYSNGSGDRISLDGNVYNASGNRVGEFARIIKRGEDGQLRAHHQELKLDPDAQGTGFATGFNAHVFEQYKRLGVAEVYTTADIDVGGYTWAATGFDFRPPTLVGETAGGEDWRTWSDRERAEWRAKQIEIMVTNAHSRGSISDAELNSIRDRIWTWWGVNEGEFDPDKHIHHAWDLAHIDGRKGVKPSGLPLRAGRSSPLTIGQRIMLNSDWAAIKHIPTQEPLFTTTHSEPMTAEHVQDWLDVPGASASLKRTSREFAEAAQGVHPGVRPPYAPQVSVGDLRWRNATSPPAAVYIHDGGKIMLGDQMGVRDREFFLAHEYGHHLDNTVVRTATGPGGYAEHEWAGFQQAVADSGMPQEIHEAHARGEFDNEMRDYMLSRGEVFARAYTRWVADRSGNERMLATQHRIEREEYGEWDDDSFGPVGLALDGLFSRLADGDPNVLWSDAPPIPGRLDLKPAFTGTFGGGRQMTTPQVKKRMQDVANDVAKFYGGEPVKTHYEPESMGTLGSDARHMPPNEQFNRREHEIWYGQRMMDNARDPDMGVMPYRMMAHEAVHASVSGNHYTHDYTHQFEEGAAEVLSLWYWHHRGQQFDKRDAVQPRGPDDQPILPRRWTEPGVESLAHSVVYRSETADLIRRTAGRVGWDRAAIVNEITRVMKQPDHMDRMGFRNETSPDTPPPPGVGTDAPSLVGWLLSGDDAAQQKPLRLYHGTSPRSARNIRQNGFNSGRGGIIFTTSHQPLARDYAGGDSGEVLPVTVALANPLVTEGRSGLLNGLRSIGVASPSAGAAGEREQVAALRAAGHDGIISHLPEDVSDPSNPTPAHTIVRVIDPSRIVVGHDDQAQVKPSKPWSPANPTRGGPPVVNGRWTRFEDYGRAQGEDFSRAQMDARDRWTREMEAAVGMGTLSPMDAKRLGATRIDTRKPEEIVPLPAKMWHATTARSAIEQGGFKSRFELGRTSGLGGGSEHTISFTDSPEAAQIVARQLEIVRAAVAGETPFVGPVYDAAPESLRRTAAGLPEEKLTPGGAQPTSFVWNQGWQPDLSTQFVGANGEPAWRRFTKPVSDVERNQARAALAIRYIKAQAEAGGDPYVFFAGDVSGIGAIPASEIGVVEVNSLPGAHGYVAEGEAVPEYRALTGASVRVVGSTPVAARSEPITSEPVLRSLFTGTFGRDGFTTHVEKIDSAWERTDPSAEKHGLTGAPSTHVSGVVRDRSGKQVGIFERTLSRQPDGGYTAYHDFMELDEQARGTGFATDFNRHLYREYAQRGVQSVMLHAMLDVGGYTWAAAGFDFDPGIQSAETYPNTDEGRAKARAAHISWMVEHAHYEGRISDEEHASLAPRLWSGELDDEGFEAELTRDHLQHAYELAHIDGQPGLLPGERVVLGYTDGKPDYLPVSAALATLGQRIMIGSDWHGIMRLAPE